MDARAEAFEHDPHIVTIVLQDHAGAVHDVALVLRVAVVELVQHLDLWPREDQGLFPGPGAADRPRRQQPAPGCRR